MEEGKAPGLSWKRVEDTLSVAPPFPRGATGSGGNTSGRSTNGRFVYVPRAVCAVSRWTSRRPRDYPSTMDTTRITPKPNGPLIVEGPVKIVTPDGRELAVPPGRTADRRKSLSCAVVEGLRPNRFVTEVTNGTASQTPRPRTSLPRFEHGVLCCLRPGRGCAGGAAPDHTRCTPPPAVPPKEERNGEGW